MQNIQFTIVRDTALEVYEELLAQSQGGTRANVLCQFPARGIGPGLAERYRFRRSSESASEVVDEIVRWWQNPTVPGGLAKRFNHGSRLRGKDEDWNQLPRIAQVLQDDPTSTKGHATLQSHRPGYADHHGHPSLCEVFFALRPDGQELKLDVTATFRKLELRYWWIVNVHELAFLQRVVIDELSKGVRPLAAAPGDIAIFAFRAVVAGEDEEPEVAIHALDRAQLFRPHVLRELATCLNVRPHTAVKYAQWKEYLEDMVPSQHMNRDGFPVCIDGLSVLASNVRLLAGARESTSLAPLAATLESLVAENESMVKMLDKAGVKVSTDLIYMQWRSKCQILVNQALKQIADLFGLPFLTAGEP